MIMLLARSEETKSNSAQCLVFLQSLYDRFIYIPYIFRKLHIVQDLCIVFLSEVTKSSGTTTDD